MECFTCLGKWHFRSKYPVIRCDHCKISGHTAENARNLRPTQHWRRLTPPPPSVVQPGMCAFAAVSAGKSSESCGTKPKVDELAWNDGAEELDDFCGAWGFGPLD